MMTHFFLVFIFLLSVFRFSACDLVIGYKEGYIEEYDSEEYSVSYGYFRCNIDDSYSSTNNFSITEFHFFCYRASYYVDDPKQIRYGIYNKETGYLVYTYELNMEACKISHNVFTVEDSPVFSANTEYQLCYYTPFIDAYGLLSGELIYSGIYEYFGRNGDLPNILDTNTYSSGSYQHLWNWFETAEIIVHYCYGIGHTNSDVCSGHGTCVAEDDCVCDSGFGYKDDCSLTRCYGTFSNESDVCSGNGECNGFDQCSCKTGYSGEQCTEYSCFDIDHESALVCNGHGTCSEPDYCSCDSYNYFGDECDFMCYSVSYDDENVCNGHGTCIDYNECICDYGFSFNSDCSITRCSGVDSNNKSVCSGKGECEGLNDCVCDDGYYGDNCETKLKCQGIDYDDADVCSGRGECVSLNQCECEYHLKYIGKNCDDKVQCYGVDWDDETVCNSRGYCKSLDNCSCSVGYSGDNCEMYSCYGIKADDSEVCSSNGVCESLNSCSCNEGYSGSKCENTEEDDEDSGSSSSTTTTYNASGTIAAIMVIFILLIIALVIIGLVSLFLLVFVMRNSFLKQINASNNQQLKDVKMTLEIDDDKEKVNTPNDQNIGSEVIINKVETNNNVQNSFGDEKYTPPTVPNFE